MTSRKPSTAPSESPLLQELLLEVGVTYAVTLKYQLDDEEADHDPLHHFNFWRKERASRLDRFYVKGDLFTAVQWIEAIHLPTVRIIEKSDLSSLQVNLSTSTRNERSGTRSLVGALNELRGGLSSLLDKYDKATCPVTNWDNAVEDIQALNQNTGHQDLKQT